MPRFAVRETNHAAADLTRNWSSFAGGFGNGDITGLTFTTAEAFVAYWDKNFSDFAAPQVRYHPAHEGFVEVHYEGLGAWALDAETVEAALLEAVEVSEYRGFLACTDDAGDGHFMASEVVAYHEVREGLYVFELND